jgi:hypothetical protein
MAYPYRSDAAQKEWGSQPVSACKVPGSCFSVSGSSRLCLYNLNGRGSACYLKGTSPDTVATTVVVFRASRLSCIVLLNVIVTQRGISKLLRCLTWTTHSLEGTCWTSAATWDSLPAPPQMVRPLPLPSSRQVTHEQPSLSPGGNLFGT